MGREKVGDEEMGKWGLGQDVEEEKEKKKKKRGGPHVRFCEREGKPCSI